MENTETQEIKLKPTEVKFVFLKRKPQTRIPGEVYEWSFKHLGSGFDTTTNDVLRGLSFDEETYILPNLIGCSNTSYEFTEKAKEFWSKIDIPVPIEGRKLNITTREAIGPLGTKVEIPVAPLDYIYYRFALKHSEVAPNLTECKNYKGYQFYIEDAGSEMKSKMSVLDLKNKSRAKYLEFSTGGAKNMELVRAILTNTKDVHGMFVGSSEESALIALEELCEKFPETFLEAASDKSLKDRAFVTQLLDYNIVTSAGNHIYDETVGIDAVAESIDEFIKYINQPKNTGYKAQLLSKLQSKKGK